MNYEQLILAEKPAELSLKEREFVEAHRRIVACCEMAGRYLFEMCLQIKRMKDEKLYLAAGFEKFGEYTEHALKLKERQAYNYVKIAETYSEKFIIENGDVGITKLALLATVTEEEREEIAENVDIATANVAEVEEAVKSALRERDEAQNQLKLYETENQDLKEKLDISESEYAELREDFLKKANELKAAETHANNLKKEATDLKNQLAEAKKATKEVKTVPDEASKKLAASEKARADELEQKLKEINAQLAAAKEQKKIIASDDLLIFKVKFNDLQHIGNEIKKSLSGMREENAAKCRKAVNAVLANWKEEMQL